MKIIIADDYEKASRQAAKLIRQAVKKNPALNLGLASGSTPQRLYEIIVEQTLSGHLDFAKARFFGLDEYFGLGRNDSPSFAAYFQRHVFSLLKIKRQQIKLLNGLANDPILECRSYENKIKKAGGIDLQILGLGRNAHIAFNEPGSPLDSRSRLVSLSPQTVKANQKHFANTPMPRSALTMGLGTILEARQIILIAAGQDKAIAVKKALNGEVRSSVPASCLINHPDVTYILDQGAASRLG